MAKENLKDKKEKVEQKIVKEEKEIKEKAQEEVKEAKNKAEDLKEKAEKKTEKIKEKAEKTTKELKNNVEDKVEEIKEKTEDFKDKAEEKTEKAKDNVQKSAKQAKEKIKENKTIVILISVLIIALILILTICYLKGHRAAAKNYLDLYINDPYKAEEMFRENKKFSDKKEKLLNKKSKYKIKNIRNKGKDKYEVEAEITYVDFEDLNKRLEKELKNNKDYKLDTSNKDEIKNNNKIELETLNKIIDETDLKNTIKKFTIFKDAESNWAIK